LDHSRVSQLDEWSVDTIEMRLGGRRGGGSISSALIRNKICALCLEQNVLNFGENYREFIIYNSTVHALCKTLQAARYVPSHLLPTLKNMQYCHIRFWQESNGINRLFNFKCVVYLLTIVEWLSEQWNGKTVKGSGNTSINRRAQCACEETEEPAK
jgi:hypothetical protein